jgi:mRNA-degrading endonuclease RelE of RelBE toxin-antitoxin system
MATYKYYPTSSFSVKLSKIRKKDPSGYKRIRKVIARLLDNPADADGVMHGKHHGRLKKYVGRRDYRIIYHWCEICRKEREKLLRQCTECDLMTDRSVMFFDLYHKNEISMLKHLASDFS